MSRNLCFPIIAFVLLGLPPLVKAQEEQLSIQEMQQMLLTQQQMLEEQRQLIEQQAKDLETQSQALERLKNQMDQMAMTGGQQAPELTEDELALQERLAKLEEQLANPPDAPEDVLRAGEFPGSMRIPGTNMAGKVGGNVRLGAVSSFDAIGSDDRFVVGTIPTEGTQAVGDERRVTISAKRSRVNLDMRMDSSVGQFRAFVEGDFAGQGGTDNYRLRHAYGQYNRFVLGQTWSTLMDRQAEPEELDFEGLNAQINERQPQMRWTRGLGNDRTFALGLEDPAPEITGGEGNTLVPDLSARITKRREWGHIQGGILLRRIRGEPTQNLDVSDASDSVFAWALTVSGHRRVRRWDERDSVKYQLSYGEGIGRYVNDLDSVGGQDAVFDPTNKLEALPAFAGYVAYQHWWKRDPSSLFARRGLLRNLRSTVVFGLVNVDNFDFQVDEAYKRTQRATLNLIWSPITAIDLGLEFLWGERKNKDNSRGTAKQLQAVATFRF